MDPFIQLIKNINNYIILNEKEFVNHLISLPDEVFKRENEGELKKFQIEGNSLKRRRDSEILSVLNLQLFLNLGNKFLINTVLKNFYNSKFRYESERIKYDIRKMRNSIKKWFDFPELQAHFNKLLEFFERAFQEIYKTIVDKVLWKLDYYMDETLSATDLAKKMKRYKDYLTTPKNWFIPASGKYFEFSSIFNFIVHILFIEYYIDSIDSNQVNTLKTDLLNTIFEHLIDLGVFDSDSEDIFLIQFIALAYVMFTSTEINIKRHLENIKPSTIKKFMINLPNFASTLNLGDNYFPGLFNKKSVISRTTAINIERYLKNNKNFCTMSYEDTLNSLENLINSRRHHSYRSAYVGILSHTILEEFFINKLRNRGFDIKFESLINIPNSLHRADLLIQKESKGNELFSNTIDGIESIVVDFTLSAKEKYIFDKLDRNYQRSDRILFIVLYSEDRNEIINDLNNFIKNIEFNYKENVRIITLEEFANRFNLKNEEKQELPIKLELFYKSINNDKILEELERLNVKCLKALENSN